MFLNSSGEGLLEPNDRDMVETRDGLMFVVVGYLHPPGRVTAYLKYVPSEEGRWRRGDTRYTRTLRYYHVTQVEKAGEPCDNIQPQR